MKVSVVGHLLHGNKPTLLELPMEKWNDQWHLGSDFGSACGRIPGGGYVVSNWHRYSMLAVTCTVHGDLGRSRLRFRMLD